jgi:outer membrane protein assembly factor BamB
LRSKLLILFGALLALAVAGCGAAPTQTWPGLATDGQLAFIAQAQQVHAIRIADGTQAWAFPATPSNTTGVFVSDAGVGDNLIVVGSEGPSGQYSGVLYGLDPTGAQQWCLAFDQKGAQRQNCPLATGGTQAGFLGLSPAVDNRIVGGVTVSDGVAYVGLANGAVYAVDASTGRDLWRFKAERDIWAAPLVNGSRLYIASLDHHVYALDLQTGEVVWSKDMGGAVAGTPTLSANAETLYVGSFGSQLYALDSASGNERWNFTATNWVWSGPALDDGMLYFTDVAGTVFALDAASGAPVWDVKPGGEMRATPALAGDLLFVGDRGGTLYALNRATGAEVWRQTVDGQLLASPLVVGEVVLVAPFQGDNLLVAYSLAGDAVRWAYAPSR